MPMFCGFLKLQEAFSGLTPPTAQWVPAGSSQRCSQYLGCTALCQVSCAEFRLVRDVHQPVEPCRREAAQLRGRPSEVPPLPTS